MRTKVKRKGDWIQTFSGVQFWPLDPRSSEVCVEDIAQALSMLCRFNGHVKEFYSVAQHCVLVSRNVPREFALWGLLHDAAEAYVGDVTRPVKRSNKALQDAHEKIEELTLKAIAERFNLKMPIPEIVRKYDDVILATESRDVMGGQIKKWQVKEKPIDKKIKCWDPKRSKREFMKRFNEIID